MRILTATLIFSTTIGFVSGSAFAVDAICGTFQAAVFAPPLTDGSLLIANAKAVTTTQFLLKKGSVNDAYAGKLLVVQVRLKSECYFQCEAELIRVERTLSPFDEFTQFHREKTSLIAAEICKRTPQQMAGDP